MPPSSRSARISSDRLGMVPEIHRPELVSRGLHCGYTRGREFREILLTAAFLVPVSCFRQ